MSDTRDLLEAIRDDLSARDEAIRSGSEMPTGGISFGKRVGEGTSIAIERFADVAIQGQIVDQIRLVDKALVRLDEGGYGQCQVCGKPIPEARLEVIPWAETCVTCA